MFLPQAYRHLGVFAIFICAAFAGGGPAQADVRKDFDKALAATNCPGIENIQAAERLVLLSEWSGHSLIELARRAGFGSNVNNLGENDTFLPADEADKAAMLDRMAKGAAEGVPRLKADSRIYGAKLCPLLANDFFEDTIKMQKRANAPVRPYLRFAQQVSRLHGCHDGPIDGAFGPATRAAWNRMAASTAPDSTVSDTGFPMPGDVLAAAVHPVAEGACDADKGAAAQALYDYIFVPTEYGIATGASTIAQFEQAALLKPTHLRNRILALVLGRWNRYEGPPAIGGTAIGEEEIFARFWPLVRDDFASFAGDVSPPAAYENAGDVYLLAAQRALYGIGVDPMPEPALILLEKLALENRDARNMLAGAYQFGIGIVPDPARATRFLLRDPSDLRDPASAFAAYEASRSDGARAADYVRAMLAVDDAEQEQREDAGGEEGGETPAFQNVSISISEIGDLSRITRLALDFPQALAVVKSARPEQRLIFGQMMLEGRGGERPARDLGIDLIASAAADGLADAALRLAHIRRYQETPDLAEAERLYGVAVDAGSPQAAFSLAEMLDEKGKFAQAKALYDRAVDLHAANPMAWDLATALQNRIVEGSPFLAAKEGAAWLQERIAKDSKLALAIGDAYLCVSCGGIVDAAQAAAWYRNAAAVEESSDRSASTKLARLLIASPGLETSKDEAYAILKHNAPAEAPQGDDSYMGSEWYARSGVLLLSEAGRRSNATPKDLNDAVQAFLGLLCPQKEGCLPLARGLANGEFDPGLTGLGYATLENLQKNADPEDDMPARALADTRAVYGDFRGAIALLRPLPAGYDDVEASLHTVKRIVAANLRRRSAELPDGLLDYVRLLAARGEDEAKVLLGLLSDPPAEIAEAPAADVATAQAAFDQQLARGALSRGLAVSARRLSEAKAAEGDKDAALKLEFTALTSELKLAAVDAIFDGALPGRLTKVCLLSRASERVSALGFDDAALTLAKYAVNELQLVRRDIAQLPEGLRTCFRDVAANHYRWLADLFVRHQRLAEARYVMGLLKDFETYEFVGRDQDYRKRGYDGFTLDQLEQDFTGALGAIAVPVTAKARWLADARWKARNGKLSDADKAEMAKVEKELAEAAKAFQQQLDTALAAARGLGRDERAADLDNLKALQSFLRSEAGRKTAALHFVVLPQRLHVILTTAQFQVSHTVETLDGAPFEEAKLDRKLDQFRALLQDPGSDPAPLAGDLYQLLIGPLQKEIEAAGINTLLVSPDRRLRYIPFATLHDGKAYLAQTYNLALLSDAGYEVAGDHRTGLEISALGMTRAAEDFSALPNVRAELAGIVKGDASSYGFLQGRIVLDKDFTRDALKNSLQFGPPDSGALGVVHIASHFALGPTDTDSNLLLGDGSLLSLADIKTDRFTYDFGSVDLLTLSACSTAYGLANSDGRDIESFSEVSRKGGARAILASLWPVNDLSTSLMMQRFYELRERRNLGKAEALATVQREFIAGTLGQGDASESVVAETARRGATAIEEADSAAPAPVKLDGFKHPFYWAPFIIMGNWQ
ncbi:CHAT domain-containing protein [Aestuariivirga sp. YIM B02566]|uniref:CHAT domain-containing protein n=1 Tax=Taklimakanibacter albus TaxID=2800327 RepID=A0ACC5R677_9HYPH|nr:CHAT domain-containing protein [Aestuariivirga sp. YIM B02566]MBK1868144.1 CHAT domain-containing protein [Aestuariivirga sp. YIM B02566]